jgi:hypothetical protein
MRRIPNPPQPAALMATARSFGNYDLAAALADLIDNSIHAGATWVSVEFDPGENDVTVRIRDDGHGMHEPELIAAMRPASANPEADRDKDDLGRFGWGLKSASLSQARVMTVITWTSSGIFGARWDIDDIDEWGMDLFTGGEASELIKAGHRGATGTEVIWTRCDRLFDVGVNATIDERLNEKIGHARRHLSLVFHRYLAGEKGSPLKIVLQGESLVPVDPFMVAHYATQTLGEERISVADSQEISVTPYIIPHFSKLSVQEREALGGDEGMVRNQGFYVYRNMRLIIHGTWFRLVPHGELSQLTRVRIDLPNCYDADWKITLDKSDAQLPVSLRSRLRDIVRKFGKRSTEVHRKRGTNLDLDDRSAIWKRNAHHGRIRYLINRDHPMIEQLLEEGSVTATHALRIIEAGVPVEHLVRDSGGSAGELVQPVTDLDEYEALVHACFLSCAHRQGSMPTLRQFLAFAKKIEPFASQWKYTESFVKERAIAKWRLQE